MSDCAGCDYYGKQVCVFTLESIEILNYTVHVDIQWSLRFKTYLRIPSILRRAISDTPH